MKSIDQVISLLEKDPENWKQGEFSLDHSSGIRVWTANIPYLNIGIYHPKRKTGFIDGIRLQLAVNKWHKSAPIKIN